MTRDPAHPDHLPAAAEPPAPPAPGDDTGASRRTFLAGAGAATVAGAAAAGGLAVLRPASPAATTTDAAAGAPGTGSATGAVVAYVRDAAAGEVRLMSGEREVVVHDRALARTLTRHFDEQEG
jgi:hypothetical protein